MNALAGGCHCGNVSVRFESGRTVEELPMRACQCTFCRKHGVRTTVDPEGRLEIGIENGEDVSRYLFGQGVAEFLVCRRCGVYVAAVMTRASGCVATLNVNVLEGAPFGDRRGRPVDYSEESVERREARRFAQWTPTVVTVRPPPSGET